MNPSLSLPLTLRERLRAQRVASLFISCLIVVLALPATPVDAVQCQSIVRVGRFYAPVRGAVPGRRPPETMPKQGDVESELVASAGLGVWPFNQPKANMDSRVLSIDMYGRAKPILDAEGDTIDWQPQVGLHVDVNTHVVDAFGDQLDALKEYLFSKKGSPLTITSGFKPWNNRRGDVKQLWFAAQGDASVKMLPLSNGTGDFEPRLAAGLGGTFEVHEDLTVGTETGNLFVVLSPSMNYVVGHGIDEVFVSDPTSATRFLAGLDFRVGIDLGGAKPLSLGVSGTASFKKLRGSGGTVSLVLSKEGF